MKSEKKSLIINGERAAASSYTPLYSPNSGEEIAQIATASKEQKSLAPVKRVQSLAK
uniref:hypothetical protein n=1 Tax=Siminovitchia terrae TaxID=1914933 RepID=UPI003570B5F3